LPVLKHINHNDMRNRNLALILNCMHQNALISRADISKLTGINKATVTGVVRELIRRGIVIEEGSLGGARKIGHPAIALRINPDAGRVVGVQIGRKFVKAVVANVTPATLWRHVVNTAGKGQQEILDCTRKVIRLALQHALNDRLPVLGVGLSVPGIVDIKRNILLCSHELGWERVDLSSLYPGPDGIPFYTGNEGHMLALGDRYYGISSRSDTIIYINLDVSVNGGIVVNSNVLPGELGLAGEMGHMSLNPVGKLCACGARGCWNTYVGEEALFDRLRSAAASGRRTVLQEIAGPNLSQLTTADILAAAAMGDALTVESLHEMGRWMGIGISNLLNLLNPEYVIIGGPLSDLYDHFYPSMIGEIERQALPWQRECLKIERVRSHEDSGVLGAVATVLWNLLNNIQQGELG